MNPEAYPPSAKLPAAICPDCYKARQSPRANCHNPFHNTRPRSVNGHLNGKRAWDGNGKDTWVAMCGECGGQKLVLAPKAKPDQPAVLYCCECQHLYKLYEVEWRKL